MIHKIFTSALVLMLLISTQVFAQDVEFFASARNQVAVGERFMLSFKINADGKDFKGPNLKDFSVLGGPNPSHSSSFQFINGNMSKQVEVSYNYILVARKEGKYTIDPAKIKVDGKIYETDPIHITVTKGSSSLPSGNTKNKQSQGQKQGQEQGPPLAFLKVVADNTSPYIGEQVLVTYKLYFRTNISDYSLKKAPSYPGFWFEDLTDKLQPGVNSQEFVNNTKYTVVDLRKELLFPQKSGKIKSGPMEFEIVARIKEQGRRSRDPFFDDFFGNYKNIQRTLVTDPIEFNVKTLPLAGKPAHFQGAVGRFNVKASVDQKELKVNDAITYKIKVNGKGNLKLIQAPKLNLPPDFEVYDPKVKENYRTSVSSGVSGTKTFEYLIIPRTPGSFKIPEIEFAYFDINTKKYKVEKTQSFDINVSKGEGGSTSSVLYAGNGKEEIRYIGTDIRHIKEGEIKLYEKGYFIITSWSFFLLLIIGITFTCFCSLVCTMERQTKRELC